MYLQLYELSGSLYGIANGTGSGRLGRRRYRGRFHLHMLRAWWMGCKCYRTWYHVCELRSWFGYRRLLAWHASLKSGRCPNAFGSFLELVFDYEALNETGSDELIQLTGRTAIEIGLSVRPCARPESQQIATSHKPTERDDSHASGPIYPHMGPGRAHRWRGAG